MTPAQAHEILDLWKSGAKHYPAAVITDALYATGDIVRHLDVEVGSPVL